MKLVICCDIESEKYPRKIIGSRKTSKQTTMREKKPMRSGKVKTCYQRSSNFSEIRMFIELN